MILVFQNFFVNRSDIQHTHVKEQKKSLDLNFSKTSRCSFALVSLYSVFHWFQRAKFAYGDLILSSSQFLLLTQHSQKMKLTSKVIKIKTKIIISLPWSKSVKQTVVAALQFSYKVTLLEGKTTKRVFFPLFTYTHWKNAVSKKRKFSSLSFFLDDGTRSNKNMSWDFSIKQQRKLRR